jgi:deferrochelatase/peroxidase EfeB
MDAGPVNATGPEQGAPRWKLDDEIAKRTQGIVVTGFGRLPSGTALFLELPETVGGGWIAALQKVENVTPADPLYQSRDPSRPRALAIAFTWTGLARLGMPETALASFSRPFREGMFQEDRLRRLGDRRGAEWLQTTGGSAPLWSGNTPLRKPPDQGVGAYDVSFGTEEVAVVTDKTVHVMLLLYARTESDVPAFAAAVETALQPFRIKVVHSRDLTLDACKQALFSREHFGFADGLSQPEPWDETGAVTLRNFPVKTADPVQGVPLGEILIGYLNGHHERAPGPVVPGTSVTGSDPPRLEAAELPPHPEAEGFFDFGLNGSYVVVRELAQNVAAFWNRMDDNAKTIRAEDPEHTQHVTAQWLADRIVGRNMDGNLLAPRGTVLPADKNGYPDSGYLFLERDPRGEGCPAGSHVRRANPRDALAPNPASGTNLLSAANNHRILRRGRKYGPPIADSRKDDRAERGLLFICLNTDIERQFEFVQQTWLFNSDFATLYEETDPLIGPDGSMTIREEPLRRRVPVDTFVTMRGGEYFFLPSLPALDYLATL